MSEQPPPKGKLMSESLAYRRGTAAVKRWQRQYEALNRKTDAEFARIYGVRVGQKWKSLKDFGQPAYIVTSVSAQPKIGITKSGPIITVRFDGDDFNLRRTRFWREFIKEFQKL